MTTNKDFKRVVRARMRKTGEAYTAARAQVLTTPQRTQPDYAAIAGVSDTQLKAKTGCTWERWVRALDRAGAATMSHRQIAALVRDKYKVGPSWTRTVTAGYERIKGLRAPAATKATPTTIDAYLATVSSDKRAALEQLRKDIHAAAPGVVECISYQMPAFRLDGRVLVWFGAASKHCSFFPGAVVQSLKEELADYKTAKGTVRFTPDHPIPAALVQKLVKARIAAIEARSRTGKRASEV